MSCSARCRRAAPGHCCCECGGLEHGAEAPVRQLPMPLEVASGRDLEAVRESFTPEPRRRSVARDGLLLLPGVRVNADGEETAGWIAAEPGTRRRLAWGLTQEEALARTSTSSQGGRAVKVTYRGHDIEVRRAKSMLGDRLLFWSIFRTADGYECASGFEDSAETVREKVRQLRERVDAELDDEDPWLEAESRSRP